jgi:hypothetical protein
MDVVEMLRPGEHLAQDNRRPAFREHLARHRYGADLTIARAHGWKPSPRGLTRQVHLLNYCTRSALRIVSKQWAARSARPRCRTFGGRSTRTGLSCTA